MFKEMTTKKKIIIGVIVLAVIVCIILFIRSRNKKKQAAANKAEESIRTVSAPVNVVEKKKSQIVPEEDFQAVKSAPEAKLSVEAVIPEKKVAAPVNNNKGPAPVAPTTTTEQPYKSVLGDEFMQNTNTAQG